MISPIESCGTSTGAKVTSPLEPEMNFAGSVAYSSAAVMTAAVGSSGDSPVCSPDAIVWRIVCFRLIRQARRNRARDTLTAT